MYIYNNHITYIQYWLGFLHENNLTVHNTHFVYMCRHACMFVCTCVPMYVKVRALYAYVCASICVHVCVYVCVCVCVCLKVTNCWEISYTPPEILYLKSLEIQNWKSIKWYGNYVINKIIIINSVSSYVNYHGMIRSATLCDCK